MFSEKHYPLEVKGQALDTYLAKGWYRMGQSIFTTHFLCFGSEFYSAIWVRLELESYVLRKSLRKLHNKNQKLFRIVYNSAVITPEKEALYQLYKKNFPAPLSPTLQEALLDLEDRNIFDTQEVCVYNKDNELVACSFFDLGSNSVASILGIYDPSYSNQSLGLYTMVLEILYCQEKQLKYYYPGYVVPGYARFDYKLRIGAVSFYNLKSNSWKPFLKLSKEVTPLWEMETQLHAVQNLLKAHKVEGQLKYYPMFEANLVSFSLTTYFDYPLLFHIQETAVSDQSANSFYIIVFNNVNGYFQLLHCKPFDSPFFYFKSEFIQSFKKIKHDFLLRLIAVSDILIETKDRKVLVHSVVDLMEINKRSIF